MPNRDVATSRGGARFSCAPAAAVQRAKGRAGRVKPSEKDFQFHGIYFVPRVLYFLITSLRKYHEAKREERVSAEMRGPQVTLKQIPAASEAEKRNRRRCLPRGWSSIPTCETFQGEVVNLQLLLETFSWKSPNRCYPSVLKGAFFRKVNKALQPQTTFC